MGGAAIILAAGLAAMAPANATAPAAAPTSTANARADAHMVGAPPRMVADPRPMPPGADPTAMSATMGQTSRAIMMPGQDMPRGAPSK